MAVTFVRQLGNEPGIQLNPLRDASGTPTADNSDQMFGIIMRATRGRIDKPFVVDRSNVKKKLGNGEQIRVNALNEAWVHVVEALNNGAYAAVVQRLVTKEAKIKYLVVKANPDAETQEDVPEYVFSAEDELPEDPFFLAVKHLECFNDGIQVEFHAEELMEGGEKKDNPEVSLRILDPEGEKLYEFKGSLDPQAKDDFGSPYYLPDVIAAQTDAVELVVPLATQGTAIKTTSKAYGYDSLGQQAWITSPVTICFTEGSTEYQTEDYSSARDKLQNSNQNYAYISSGGNRSPALIYQLAQLAFDTNRQLRFDIPGDLEPTAAIAFLEQLNLSSNKTAHLMQAYWSPLKSDDPTGVNPKAVIGVATLNIAFACARNAQRNAKGFAPKNYPIGGKEWPINRTGISQIYAPTNQEKSQLAAAKINPCLYEVYTAGGLYTYTDVLTCAPVTNSARKLISVADMSTDIDDKVTRAGKDFLLLPMEIAVKRMRDYLTTLFEGAEASGWLVPASDPAMGGRAWMFEVKPNEVNPFDQMDVNYWLRYDGAVRQIFVTQTLVR